MKNNEEKLKPLEETVLRMLVGNMTKKEITFALEINESYFEELLKNIFGKLRVDDDKEAVDKALNEEIVSVKL